MSLRAVDPIGSDAEPIGFELDRLRRDGERGLEVRGRWSGVRGRRFVRPTLTLRIDGAKHRLLADLEHKPWAAEEGEEWVALFSPAPPAGKADRIELSVAPDITIALSTPGSRGSSAKMKRPAEGARAPARPTTGGAGAPPRAPARRKSQAGRAQPEGKQEGAKAREEARELEAAVAAQARLAAERDALLAERDKLRADLDALVVERDGMRRQHTRARKRVTELQGELKALEARAAAGLSEARDMLEAERAQTSRLRAALESGEAKAGDDGRLADELASVVAERDRLAEQVSQARAARPEASPVRRPLPSRSVRRAPVWAARTFALTAMIAVVLAFAHALHYV
jgi:hypothetical protein